jgi:hypothetical protein
MEEIRQKSVAGSSVIDDETKIRRGSRNFWWGDDMDDEKIGRGLGPP